MPSEDKILRDGLADTSEAKRIYGGGRVMTPSDMGFDGTLSDSMSGGPEVQKRSTDMDASEWFARQEAKRRRNARGRSSGTDGGDPPKRKTLEEWEDKMRADYKASGENYLKNNQPESLEDFKKDVVAQTEFAQAAAVQDFNKADKSEYPTGVLPYTIDGEEYDVFTFDDGSEYLIFPDADINNLQPGDVLRTNPAES